MIRRGHLLIPIFAIVTGVVVLIGCFPVPTLRQQQGDGTPRPEKVIGPEADRPVRIGQSTLVDTLIELRKSVGVGITPKLIMPSYPLPYWRRLQVSPDKRNVSMQFDVRSRIGCGRCALALIRKPVRAGCGWSSTRTAC